MGTGDVISQLLFPAFPAVPLDVGPAYRGRGAANQYKPALNTGHALRRSRATTTATQQDSFSDASLSSTLAPRKEDDVSADMNKLDVRSIVKFVAVRGCVPSLFPLSILPIIIVFDIVSDAQDLASFEASHHLRASMPRSLGNPDRTSLVPFPQYCCGWVWIKGGDDQSRH